MPLLHTSRYVIPRDSVLPGPSPALVLQATNAWARRPGNEATYISFILPRLPSQPRQSSLARLPSPSSQLRLPSPVSQPRPLSLASQPRELSPASRARQSSLARPPSPSLGTRLFARTAEESGILPIHEWFCARKRTISRWEPQCVHCVVMIAMCNVKQYSVIT